MIVFLVVALIIGTFLRVTLLITYPLITLFLVTFFRLRVSRALLILCALLALVFFMSLYPHPFLKYKFVSLFHLLPFILLLFAQPGKKYDDVRYSRLFAVALTAITIINDLIGLVQILINPYSDDSFRGIYTQYSLSLNGLMLMNIVLFYFHFITFVNKKNTGNLFISLFFLVCAVLCFYGAGLIVCMAAFILSLFRINVKSVVTTCVVALVSVTAVYYAMKFIKPKTLEYNIQNIKDILKRDLKYGPRKVKSFYNYAYSYPRNPKDFLFGSGPGTFNSRSAFMVGSPSYFSSIGFIKDDDQPYYFKNYAYTLWNEGNTRKQYFEDGFRNQPFSSLLAFLGEYGFVFFLVFFVLYYRQYRKTSRAYRTAGRDPETNVSFRYFKFLAILLPMLLLIDNYLEYPEIILLIGLAMKLAQIDLHKYQTSTADVS
jgi:hypothetical protein